MRHVYLRTIRWRTSTRPFVRLGLILLLITVVSVGLALTRPVPAASAQGKLHDHHTPGSIIGQDTPHLIPRDVVLGLFLRNINAAAVQTPPGTNYVRAYFNRMQRETGETLTADDRAAISLAAAAYVARTANAIPQEFRNLRQQALSELSAWLAQALTPSGQLALERQLERMKISVKILK